MIDNKIPSGSLENKWSKYLKESSLVNPTNRRKYKIIVIGTGLAGSSAASSLAEQGYEVVNVCLQDTPRRAHSVAAQGGVNGAKNYKNDGDSVWRLFKDTLKGGDFRSREGNVYRLAELSNKMIDHCVALGIPFAREYGGYLANRSFGGSQLQRTFYARGQTGQQLLLGVYSSLLRQINAHKVTLYTRYSFENLFMHQDQVRGVYLRDLFTQELLFVEGHAVVLATGGYSNAFYLSTNAASSNVSPLMRAFDLGAYFANPCFTQIHPTCIPIQGDHQAKLTLMSESLRNDGRVWVSKKQDDKRPSYEIPKEERDYYLERLYPSFGNLVPRDIASRQAKFLCDKGYGALGQAVYLDFQDSIQREGKEKIQEKYGNLFEMYEHITNKNPYKEPMRIYPAPHYTMGGLWVDYELMSNLKGLFVVGEANFSDHGANRLGASALMQGLVDGLFIISQTLPNYLANTLFPTVQKKDSSFSSILEKKGSLTPSDLHKMIGKILWDKVGMSRNSKDLQKAFDELSAISLEDMIITKSTWNYAQQVKDYKSLGMLMAKDALIREESCGSHFREEYQTKEQEAVRRDDHFAHVSLWNHKLEEFKEPLVFEALKPTVRSYK